MKARQHAARTARQGSTHVVGLFHTEDSVVRQTLLAPDAQRLRDPARQRALPLRLLLQVAHLDVVLALALAVLRLALLVLPAPPVLLLALGLVPAQRRVAVAAGTRRAF